MKLGQIILYSGHIEQLCQLLAEVFEGHVLPTEEGVQIEGPGFRLLILKEAKKSEQSNNFILEFALEEEEDLHELERKLEFYAYRHDSKSGFSYEKKKFSDSLSLILKDFDEREWKFTVKSH